MNYNPSLDTGKLGIQLNAVTIPLQAIAGLSALVFVSNFTFEILDAYGATLEHLISVLSLIFALSIWAVIESLLIYRSQNGTAFKTLRFLLLGQVSICLLRSILMAIDLHVPSQTDWLQNPHSHNYWHFLFLIPYSLFFIAIQREVIRLFSLNEKLRAKNAERQMLITLNAMAMARDNETGNHILRTQNYVRLIAKRLRQMHLHSEFLTDQYIDLLFNAAPLHDVGKVGIPDMILHKSGSLTQEEWAIMKTHTTIGESILSSAIHKLGASDDVIAKAIEIASGHHERWDGTGYPRGLKGENIPLSARIMALADMYDALISERVYKKSWSHDEAAAELVRISGSHLDPDVVRAFIADQSAFQEIALSMQD